MKAKLKKIALWFGGVTAVLLVCAVMALALALSWLDSTSGRRWLAAEIQERAKAEGLNAEIGTIRDLSIGGLDVESLSFSDDRGTLFSIRNLRIRFEALTLLAGQWHFSEISAESLTLARLPEMGDKEEEGEGAPFTLPRLWIDAIALEKIVLEPPLTAEREELALTGRLALSSSLVDSVIDLTLRDLRRDKEIGAVYIGLAKESGDLTAAVSIRDEGDGLVASLLDLPGFSLILEGEGTSQGWRGALSLSAGESITIAGDMTIAFPRKNIKAGFTGTMMYGDQKANGILALTHNYKTGLTGFSYQGDFENPGMTLHGVETDGEIGENGMFKLSASAETIRTGVDKKPLDYLAGSTLALEGRYHSPALSLSRIALTTSAFEGVGEAKLNLREETLDASLSVTAADISRFEPSVTGAGRIEIETSGNYGAMNFSGAMQAAIDQYGGAAAAALGPVPTAHSDFRYEDDTLTLEGGTLETALLDTTEFSGAIKADGTGSLGVTTGWQDYTLRSVLAFDAEKLTARSLTIDGPAAHISGTTSYGFEGGALAADLAMALAGTHQVKLRLSGTAGEPAFSGTAAGVAGQDYDFSYAGTLHPDGTPHVVLTKFEGRYGPNPFRLKAPWMLTYEEDTAQIGEATLSFGGGSAVFGGRANAERADLTLKLQDIPANLGLYPFIFDGLISGSVSLTGPYTGPEGQADLKVERIAIPGFDQAKERYVGGGVTAALKGGRLRMQADLKGPAELSFAGHVILPLSLSPPAIPEHEILEGEISANVDLNALTLLLGFDEHRVNGRAGADIRLSGTLAAPQINGTGNLREGSYDNILTGTALRDITADAEFSGDAVTLTAVSGRDENGGRFSGKGAIDFKELQNPHYDFSLEAHKLLVLNQDDLGLTASGKLRSRGDSGGGALEGDIAIDHAEYYITEIPGSSPYSGFTIVEKGAEDTEKQSGAYPDVTLDIAVRAEHGVYVRGPDLETEWGGTIRATGTLEEPRLKGAVSLVRKGRFALLDTPVELTEGRLGFDGSYPVNPDLKMRGVIRGRDLDAIINVSGTASSPSVALSSEPAYPEDEILARALFGTSVDQLSPVQALRIAQMLALLSGRKDVAGFDPLADIRRTIGVDTLSVSMEEEGASVTFGKYVSDRVYIAVDQGISAESSAVRTEIEVTDDIDVETKINSTSETSIGVNWKRDY